MATRAEKFKAKVQRSGPNKARKPARKPRDTHVDTARPGVSATDRKVGKGSSAKRNASERAGRKAEVQLEDSKDKPTRKSTRRSKHGGKTSSPLERRAKLDTRKPKARAARAIARRGRS